ncbi:hypothetical protein KPH14_012677 [Odynerus spinipes]|uniref:DDE-1 domain-containing protein n=1 Tax=Odynerus spinipes TaxID=1348599 RepID=A0AAD9REG6_9HYME|nr:hypothetical protein KPH14_012677 [Odynerus spinipes]
MPVVLDNHFSHLHVETLNLAKENGIIMLSFPPHCSHKLQPLDVSVFGPFKKYCASAQDTWLRNNPGKTITIYDTPKIVADSLPFAQTSMNIMSGFRKTGIFPFNANIFSADEFSSKFSTEDPEKKYWCLDSATVKAKGNVRITTRMNNEIKDIELEEALYVPELRSNLMSVAKITDKGNSVIFKNKEAIIVGPDGRIKLMGKRLGNLYYICETPQVTAKNILSEGARKSPIELWHERLGHLNIRDLIDVVKNERAIGIKLYR